MRLTCGKSDKLDLTLLTEESFRLQLREMGFSSDEADYQLEGSRSSMLAK